MRAVVEDPDWDNRLDDYEALVDKLREERLDREVGMTIGQMQEVANAVTQYYRNAGFILAQAYIPAQDVASGVVVIEVIEGTLGNDAPVATGRTRIVVFYASTGHLKTGYFGILTQGFPQLVRVNKDVLKLDATEGWPEAAPVLCRVRMINEYPLIPNLEKLEEMLAEELTQA